MKRKVYASDHERKSDQRFGCIAFPLINVPLWLITGLWLGWVERNYYHGSRNYVLVHTCIMLLPWLVNGFILNLASYFRPQIGVGYVASIFFIIVAGLVLGGLFVVSCLVSLPLIGLPFPILFLIGFIILFLIGFIYLARQAYASYQNWWSPPPKDTKEVKGVKDGGVQRGKGGKGEH